MNHASVNMADRHDVPVPEDLLNEAVLCFGDELRIKDVFKVRITRLNRTFK